MHSAPPSAHTDQAQACIPFNQLLIAVVAARMRRQDRGRTCQLCVLSAAPLVDIDCHTRWSRASAEAEARHRGLAEVRRTWASGLRALRAEPHHVLNGGH